MPSSTTARVPLHDLLTDVDVVALRGDAGVAVTDLVYDSRRVRPGSCFACIRGARDDGHAHAREAARAGAVALLVEHPTAVDVSVVTEAQVPDVRRALGPAAAAFHGHPSDALRCLGVTGTNGKTTVTYLLESIARVAGEPVGVIGTTGVRLDGQAFPLERTTPEAPDLQDLLARLRDRGVRTVAMEVSSHALAQHRVDGTRFAAVGFINLSRDHLDYHLDVERYFDAKASLFDPRFAATGAVNLDDPRGHELVVRARARGLTVLTFGVDGGAEAPADVIARDVRVGTSGTTFELVDRRTGSEALVELALLGALNVENALAASAVALAGGLPFDALAPGLAALAGVPGRLEAVDAGQPFRVIIDYAHTPDALAAVLASCRVLAGSARVIVVFGAGGDRDHDKRPLMGEAAGSAADVAIVTTDNARSEAPEAIARQVLAGMDAVPARVLVRPDRREAIALAIDEARPGDVVLIAGKGHEATQTIGDSVLPFDDRVVAAEALGGRSWS